MITRIAVTNSNYFKVLKFTAFLGRKFIQNTSYLLKMIKSLFIQILLIPKFTGFEQVSLLMDPRATTNMV